MPKEGAEGADLLPNRPSLILSLAYENGTKEHRETLDAWWSGREGYTF